MEAKEVCKKSEATVWRYMTILMETRFGHCEGSTNKIKYKRARIYKKPERQSADRRLINSDG